jgi:DNA polymerase beta
MATPNKDRILQFLETMRQGDLIRGEKFSAIAYSKAMKAMKALSGDITSVDDVKNLAGVGAKIQAKVQEILETGSLKSAERTKKEHNLDIYDALMKVHGIGPVAARKLVKEHEIKSIADLRSKQHLLNDVQVMGLKYYEDILERIPRAEMFLHEKLLTSCLPKNSTGVIVGSFRRQAESSGDIDMLITFEPDVPESQQKKSFLNYVESLKSCGYVRDILASGPKKCMAVVSLGAEKKARRLDLLITPYEEFAYSILYFTGSDVFNVAFRKHALTCGYTLNEHKMTPTGDKPVPPTMRSEKDIFDFLGLKYIEPQNRKADTDVSRI